MSQLEFSQVIFIEILPAATEPLSVPSGKVWKIESAGIAGTGGSLFLLSGVNQVGILYSTMRNNFYGSGLPFWIGDSFSGSVFNDSTYRGSLSISEWSVTP